MTVTRRCAAGESAAGGGFHGLVRRELHLHTRRSNVDRRPGMVSWDWDLASSPIHGERVGRDGSLSARGAAHGDGDRARCGRPNELEDEDV